MRHALFIWANHYGALPATSYRLPATTQTNLSVDTIESTSMKPTPLVAVVMGSKSDYESLAPAVEILREFGIPYEARVVSAHRTPDLLFEFASQAETRGLRVIIAGAGGAAHLPGMLASKTLVPVLGVPIPATMLQGFDSLLSIVQMPKGRACRNAGHRQARAPRTPRCSRLRSSPPPTRICGRSCMSGATARPQRSARPGAA